MGAKNGKDLSAVNANTPPTWQEIEREAAIALKSKDIRPTGVFSIPQRLEPDLTADGQSLISLWADADKQVAGIRLIRLEDGVETLRLANLDFVGKKLTASHDGRTTGCRRPGHRRTRCYAVRTAIRRTDRRLAWPEDFDPNAEVTTIPEFPIRNPDEDTRNTRPNWKNMREAFREYTEKGQAIMQRMEQRREQILNEKREITRMLFSPDGNQLLTERMILVRGKPRKLNYFCGRSTRTLRRYPCPNFRTINRLLVLIAILGVPVCGGQS